MKKLFTILILLCISTLSHSQAIMVLDTNNSPIQHFRDCSVVSIDSLVYFSDSSNIVYAFDGINWTNDTIPNFSGNVSNIKELTKGRDNNLYAVTDSFILQKNGNTWIQRINLTNILEYRAFTIDSASTIWYFPSYTDTARILKYAVSGYTVVQAPSQYPNLATLVGVVDDSLHLYFSTFNYGIIKYDGSTFTQIAPIIVQFSYYMAMDEQNNLWSIYPDTLGAHNGVLKVNDNGNTSTFQFSGSANYFIIFAQPEVRNNKLHTFLYNQSGPGTLDYINMNSMGDYRYNIPSTPWTDSSVTSNQFDIYGNFWSVSKNGIHDCTIRCIKFSSFNKIKGHCYHDVNNNGLWDNNESPLPKINVSTSSQSGSFNSNSNGEFEILLGNSTGTYQVTANPPSPWVISSIPSIYTITQTQISQVDSGLVFGFHSPQNVMLELSGAPNLFRLGNNGIYHLVVRNLSTTKLDSIQVTLDYDSYLTYSASSPMHSSHLGNKLTWWIDSLGVLENKHIYVEFPIPVSSALGTVLNSVSNVSYQSTIGTGGDTLYLQHIILAPMDPNNKLEYHQHMNGCVNMGDTLNYTINFQNCGNDTAFKVVLLDTLSPLLNLSTLHFTGSSHNYQYQLVGNELEITFDSINLVDSNANYNASMGFINYSIAVGNYIPYLDTSLVNRAFIYFDFNPAVITNYTSTVLCTGIGIESNNSGSYIHIQPNPVSDFIQIHSELSVRGKSYGVYSSNGSLLQTGIFEDEFINQLDLKSLSNGIYFLEIDHNKMIKIVKQ